MDEERSGSKNSQITIEKDGDAELREEKLGKDGEVLRLLDSLDNYLCLLDSLSTTLSQGWLELASARHSTGTSRINSALLDLKCHSAATSLRITESNVDSMSNQPSFSLCKWSATNDTECFGEGKYKEDKLPRKSDGPQLRHRGTSGFPDTVEGVSLKKEDTVIVDDPVQKERSKSLSIFGTLVSPKLRSAQLSFEKALEIIVEIANNRTSILSSFDQVKKEIEDCNESQS